MSWRDNPDLVKPDEPAAVLAVDPHWERVFEFLKQAQDNASGPYRMFIGAFGTVLRQKVVQDPEGTRNTVIQVMRLMAASLQLEPSEIYALEPQLEVRDGGA